MDTFAEKVATVPDSVSEHPVQLFADDVKLHAKTGKGLQKIFDIATSWATRNSMKWNNSPGKSEVLKYEGLPKHKFWLAGRELYQAWRLCYLGVSMDAKGVTDHTAIARVKSAVGAINRLRKVGLNVMGFHPVTSVKIFKTLIRTR